MERSELEVMRVSKFKKLVPEKCSKIAEVSGVKKEEVVKAIIAGGYVLAFGE